MAKLSKSQISTLKEIQFRVFYGRSDDESIIALLGLGLIYLAWYDDRVWSQYCLTPAGLAYLYQDAPMVDQPQPSSEVELQPFKAGDLVYYVNAHNHTCTATVMNVTGDAVMILTSAGGKLERPASDLQMVTGSYNDDLPFTDIGNDPDDTQELPAVKTEYIPEIGDQVSYVYGGEKGTGVVIGIYPRKVAIEVKSDTDGAELTMHRVDLDLIRHKVAPAMSLSQLVDAALDPDNTEAFETLKAYDLTNVPLWILEIERNDLADLKWALWSECRKINAGTLMSNPDYVAKQIEVNRAFQVCDILHKEVVNRKAVGFNVLE